ncbi:MAG: hypothetical protein ACI88L_000659 [Candidatus Paceibacteria bacterium]|jgi:hypothetical protein
MKKFPVCILVVFTALAQLSFAQDVDRQESLRSVDLPLSQGEKVLRLIDDEIPSIEFDQFYLAFLRNPDPSDRFGIYVGLKLSNKGDLVRSVRVTKYPTGEYDLRYKIYGAESQKWINKQAEQSDLENIFEYYNGIQ